MNSDKLNCQMFIPDENRAMDFFRNIRWSNGVYCPNCGSFKVIKKGSQGRTHRYFCNSCEKNFSDFTGTEFAKCHVPIGVVFYIMMNLDKKSSKLISEEIGYSRQTVYRISNLIRDSLLKNHENPKIDGKIEIDEMYISAGNKGIKKNFQEKED